MSALTSEFARVEQRLTLLRQRLNWLRHNVSMQSYKMGLILTM